METTLERLSEHIGQRVAFTGAVHKIRRMSGFAFVIIRGPRGVQQCTADIGIEDLLEGCCVRAVGDVVQEPRARSGFEVRLLSYDILSAPHGDLPIVINNKELPATLEHLLDLRPVTLRNPLQRAVFKLQEGIERGFRQHCEAEGLTAVHTPKIVYAGAEGGANIFALDYFGKTAFLAQSPQFYKQMMTGVFGRVYEVGPVYRAEKHDTARHLNEYTSMDVEMGYIGGFHDIIVFQQAMLRHISALLSEEYAPELSALRIEPPKPVFAQFTFDEVKRVIVEGHFRAKAEDDADLSPDEERMAGAFAQEKHGADFVYVTHYPSRKRPFYAMDDPADTSLTLSFDLLYRGMEVTTGGQRIHDYDAQTAKMARLGMDTAAFEPYLQAHKAGLPPHGGFGMGLERMTMQLCGLDNIRRATLFPRDTARLTP